LRRGNARLTRVSKPNPPCIQCQDENSTARTRALSRILYIAPQQQVENGQTIANTYPEAARAQVGTPVARGPHDRHCEQDGVCNSINSAGWCRFSSQSSRLGRWGQVSTRLSPDDITQGDPGTKRLSSHGISSRLLQECDHQPVHSSLSVRTHAGGLVIPGRLTLFRCCSRFVAFAACVTTSLRSSLHAG
jgi:hypothetical protein